VTDATNACETHLLLQYAIACSHWGSK